MKRRFHVILNANSGTASALGVTSDSLEAMFGKHGLDAEVDWRQDDTLEQRIARAKASDADVIVAAGGDGTVSAVAEAVVDAPQMLAILPLGTANALARDLGLPLDLEEAIKALATYEPREIDIGEVNGRAFLHTVSLGDVITSPATVRERIRGHNGIGTKLAFARYFLRRLARARPFAVEITPREGERRVERVQAVAVLNNDLQEGLGRIFARDRLDGGTLTLYVLRRLGVMDFLRLLTGMVFGNWRQDEAIEIDNVTAVTINMRRRTMQVMIDGEVQSMDMPLRFRIRPGDLQVLAPPAPASAPAPELAGAA